MGITVNHVLLRDLWAWEDAWAAVGFDARRWLAPGLPAARVAATLAGEGLPPAVDVVTWFSWHDGQAQEFPLVDLAPSRHYPLSLDQALRRRRELLESAASAAEAADWEPAEYLWEPAWLPLGEDAGGGTLAVELVADTSRTGPVQDVDWEDPSARAPAALDLHQAVHVWLRGAASGEWRWDSAAGQWDVPYDMPVHLPEYLRGCSLIN